VCVSPLGCGGAAHGQSCGVEWSGAVWGSGGVDTADGSKGGGGGQPKRFEHLTK